MSQADPNRKIPSGQSKLLKSVILLQFVVLAFVVYQTIWINGRLQHLSLKTGDVPIDAEGNTQPDLADQTLWVRPELESLDEEKLRKVIRSELAAFAGALAVPAPEVIKEGPEIDTYENQLLLEVVKDKLSYYIETGEISDADMQNLQFEISRLDPESRTLMFRRLTQAIATGKIDGRF